VRVPDQLHTAGQLEFLHQAQLVSLDRLGAELQVRSGLLGGVALTQQAQDLGFSPAESFWIGWRLGASFVKEAPDRSICQVRIVIDATANLKKSRHGRGGEHGGALARRRLDLERAADAHHALADADQAESLARIAALLDCGHVESFAVVLDQQQDISRPALQQDTDLSGLGVFENIV
jgi:hypothetical protein